MEGGQGVGAAPSLALSGRASFQSHFSSHKTHVTSEIINEDAFLRPSFGRANSMRGLRPVTFLLVIASIAMTTFLILQCLRTMRRAFKQTPHTKRALAASGGGGDVPECSAGGSTVPAPLTTAQAQALTAKIRASKEKVLDLKNPRGGPSEIDQPALEAALMEAASLISEGFSVEYDPTVDQATQQTLQEEVQDLLAAASSAVAVLSETWIDILDLRNGLLQSSLSDLEDHARQHSPNHPPQPSSPVLEDLLEVRGRVTVARELCSDFERFIRFPFQQGPLNEPLENLQARITEVETTARNIVDVLMSMWRTRLMTLRQGVAAGTRSQVELIEAEEDAKAFTEAVNNVTGFGVSLE
ncbi:hypothetical protein Emed_007493 [Eimeria media]